MGFSNWHPSLDRTDAFYLRRGGGVLRTHTTAGLSRMLGFVSQPFRGFTLGRVYRQDDGLNHLLSFTQLEGVVVCRSCSIACIAKLLKLVVSRLLEAHAFSRLRCAQFPFTCPSIELDLCKSFRFSTSDPGFEWLEVAGAGRLKSGVVSQSVLKVYAFGVGLERLLMVDLGLKDLKVFKA